MPSTINTVSPVFWLFFQSFIVGLLAVFTPYVYTIHPFTIGFLTRNVKTARGKLIKSLIYVSILILFFTTLGILVSVIIKATGLYRFTENWVFNLFLVRVFAILGISFLGAFSIKIPAAWINWLAGLAKTNDLKGIFFMAITLPFASFASTFPIMGLVLVLAWNISPVVGLFGFAVGLSLPFVFPAMHNIFARSKSLLNNIKSILGFLSLMLSLKFLSKADISLGYNLIDRELFIEVWMAIWTFMGIYMLGLIRFPYDTEPEQNIYGQEYVSLIRLFISIIAFVFALYLLPGIWGAPLHGVSGFLPPS